MHNRGIAMWGPPGSGKTWLIWAFIKALENSYENDAKFSYHLSGKDRTGSWSELFASTPKVAPTNSYCNYEWRFEKRVKDTSSAQGGARTNSIILCDDAGKRTVGALSEPERYRNTYHTLSHTAQAVVLYALLPYLPRSVDIELQPSLQVIHYAGNKQGFRDRDQLSPVLLLLICNQKWILFPNL